MDRRSLVIWLSIYLGILVLLGLSVGMAIRFWYLNETAEFHHHQSGICQVLSCNSSILLCHDRLCEYIKMTYDLLNTSVMPSYQQDSIRVNDVNDGTNSTGCPPVNSIISCYYDDRDISATLRLTPYHDNADGAIIFIIILCVIASMALCIGLNLLVEWCLNTFNPDGSVTTPSQPSQSSQPSQPSQPVVLYFT
jgi:flagellar basal body-associated protein FliL